MLRAALTQFFLLWFLTFLLTIIMVAGYLALTRFPLWLAGVFGFFLLFRLGDMKRETGLRKLIPPGIAAFFTLFIAGCLYSVVVVYSGWGWPVMATGAGLGLIPGIINSFNGGKLWAGTQKFLSELKGRAGA